MSEFDKYCGLCEHPYSSHKVISKDRKLYIQCNGTNPPHASKCYCNAGFVTTVTTESIHTEKGIL